MPAAIVAGLLEHAQLDVGLDGLVLTGAEPVLPSSFRVDAAAQAAIAAAGLAAAEMWRRRTGRAQGVAVDMRAAAAEFRSERHVRLDGAPPGESWDAIAGVYRTADGWVRLHTNFPHHRAGVVRLLGCADTREAVAAALATRRAEAFETEATEAGMCVAALRDFAAWDAHPHGQWLRGVPPLRIERIGDAPPRGFAPDPARPLSGVRVLELTRVIAGPVAGRTLAAHGADVLHITGPGVPNMDVLLPDTNRGKRPAELDLRAAAGAARLRELVGGADVFLQSYRHGALAGLGFGAGAVTALRPGIVHATLSAYGEDGPWGGKRGFDSLVQVATGFNAAEADAAGSATPRALPCQALDHASGYLLALGTMAALLRRAEEGGSWQVRVSLAGTGNWLRSLGRLPLGLAAADPGQAEVADLLEESDSEYGRMQAVRHAAVLSETPAHWALPARRAGSSPAAW
ncbi:MAG: carnitine dehydratase [Rhodospirillales bacterium 70-18]|nr:MAG: carnitine dehydratase [Rhodospirillales bacterium 70-18]